MGKCLEVTDHWSVPYCIWSLIGRKNGKKRWVRGRRLGRGVVAITVQSYQATVCVCVCELLVGEREEVKEGGCFYYCPVLPDYCVCVCAVWVVLLRRYPGCRNRTRCRNFRPDISIVT
eukprot:sb/3476407/